MKVAKLFVDVWYSRRQRHHQIYDESDALVWSGLRFADAVHWAKTEGFDTVEICGLHGRSEQDEYFVIATITI